MLLLVGAYVDAADTFARARGVRYWPTAGVLLGGVLALELGRREADPVLWVFAPCALMLALMASYPLTALARVICGGRLRHTDATASQGVIVQAAAALPGSLLAVLGVPDRSAVLVTIVLLVVAAASQVSLWSAAFESPRWLAVLAYLAVLAVTVVAVIALVALLSPDIAPAYGDSQF
jgi:hypothetical protein